MNTQRISRKFLVLAVATGLSAGTVQAGPLNDVLGQLGLSGGLTQLSGALDTSGPLTQLPFGNPADLLGVTVLEGNNRGNSPLGIGASVGSGHNTGNGGLAGVGVLAGNNAGNGGQIGVGVLSEGNNGAGQAISLQLLNADTALGLALGGNEILAVENPNGTPVLDPISGGDLNQPLRDLLGAQGPIVGPIADGLRTLGTQARASAPETASNLPVFGMLELPGLEGSGPIAIALLGGQNATADLISAGVITGPNTGNTTPDGLAGASAISSGSSGNGGDIGVGAITGSHSGNGQVAGIAAITGENSNSGNGGYAGVGVLSGNNSATGAQLANAGVLNGNNTANDGIVNAGALNGSNSANNGTVNAGVLNGPNSANNGTVNVSVLNGPNSGQGGLIDVGVINAPDTPPPPAPPGDLSYLASCENDRDDPRRVRAAEGVEADAAAPALANSAAGPGLKTAFNKRVAEKRNCEDLIKAKAKQADSAAAQTASAEPAAAEVPAQ